MKVKTLRSFNDLKENVVREPGDEFDATEARAKQIARKLPGYVELVNEGGAAEERAEAPKPKRRRTTTKAKTPDNK